MWMKIDLDLKHHPKTKRLARRLGASVPEVMGYLICLWSWAFKYAQDGDLSGFDDEEIMIEAGYEGEPEAFVSALLEVGLIDKDTRKIHDWDEHCGSIYKDREKTAARVKRCRATQQDEQGSKEAVTSQSCNTDITPEKNEREQEAAVTSPLRNADVTPLDIDIDIEKERDIEKEKDLKTLVRSEVSNARERDEYPEAFKLFWQVYPRHVNKTGAFKAWARKCRSGKDVDAALDIHSAAMNYAEHCRRRGTEEQYIMHPSTFLGKDDRWREYVGGIPKEAMSSYERAIREGPELGGAWAELYGSTVTNDSENEVIDIDGSGIPEICGAASGSGRDDEWEIPY